jgi:hypothetical protein
VRIATAAAQAVLDVLDGRRPQEQYIYNRDKVNYKKSIVQK